MCDALPFCVTAASTISLCCFSIHHQKHIGSNARPLFFTAAITISLSFFSSLEANCANARPLFFTAASTISLSPLGSREAYIKTPCRPFYFTATDITYSLSPSFLLKEVFHFTKRSRMIKMPAQFTRFSLNSSSSNLAEIFCSSEIVNWLRFDYRSAKDTRNYF